MADNENAHTPEQLQEMESAIAEAPMPADHSHPEGVNVKPADTPDFENLLSEFESEVPKPEQDDPLRFDEPLSQEHAILDYLSALEQDRQIGKQRAAFDSIVEQATSAIADAQNLPHDYARLRMEQWGRNEYAANPEFAKAWDGMFQGGDGAQFVSQSVKKAIGNLKKEVAERRVIDHEATADRDAVVAAMTRGADKPPPPPQHDYASMTEVEFNREVEKEIKKAGQPNG